MIPEMKLRVHIKSGYDIPKMRLCVHIKSGYEIPEMMLCVNIKLRVMINHAYTLHHA